MGLQQEKTTKGGSIQTRGPSMQADDLPPNPSDEIFQGRALPIRPAQAETKRRAFTCVTSNPLHYNEGPGTDEVEGANRMNRSASDTGKSPKESY